MVKSKNNNNNKKRSAKTGSNGRIRVRGGPGMADSLYRLDAAALAYRRLLLDPCNAPLVAPPYAGFGSGSYLRLKTFYISGSSTVDAVYVFQPGTNLRWSGGAATLGGTLTFTAADNIFNISGTNTQVRALAACAKVRYTGAESARSGVIGLMVGTPSFAPLQTATSTLSGLVVSPCVTRFGETSHEVRWMPAAADEEFHDSAAASYQPRSSCMTVVVQGAPAGAFQIEVTVAYEVEGTNTASTPMVATAPPSVNTTNHVLRSLGDYTMWAFTNVAVPVLKATAHAGVAMYSRGAYARTINQNRIGLF